MHPLTPQQRPRQRHQQRRLQRPQQRPLPTHLQRFLPRRRLALWPTHRGHVPLSKTRPHATSFRSVCGRWHWGAHRGKPKTGIRVTVASSNVMPKFQMRGLHAPSRIRTRTKIHPNTLHIHTRSIVHPRARVSQLVIVRISVRCTTITPRPAPCRRCSVSTPMECVQRASVRVGPGGFTRHMASERHMATSLIIYCTNSTAHRQA